MVSIVIPTYNESCVIPRTLEQLRRARGNFEIIVVDGESTDGTCARVNALIPGFPRPLRFLSAERSRALQLNRGAELACGDAFLFLHADVLLPPESIECLEHALRDGSIAGGNFRLVFEGHSAWNTFFTWVNRVRRSLGIYYGDSGLFVRREIFQRLGGFKPFPIMDDYDFVRRLERAGRTVCLRPVVLVSDRRWQLQGIFKTLLSWVWVQSLYTLGIPPRYLARWYRPVRESREVRPRELLEAESPSTANNLSNPIKKGF